MEKKSIFKKFMEKYPPTEDGLNKARYRLAYEDGYRQCIKDAAEWLDKHLFEPCVSSKPPLDAASEFINKFKENLEDKL